MGYLVAFAIGESGTDQVIADLGPVESGVIPAGVDPGQVARRAATTFDAALDQIRLVANTTMDRIQKIGKPPDKTTIKFGLRLSADVGAVITRAAGEANLEVTLTWSSGGRD